MRGDETFRHIPRLCGECKTVHSAAEPCALMVTRVLCPECDTEQEGDHCANCGSLLHPDHVRERRDRRAKEWADSLTEQLTSGEIVKDA